MYTQASLAKLDHLTVKMRHHGIAAGKQEEQVCIRRVPLQAHLDESIKIAAAAPQAQKPGRFAGVSLERQMRSAGGTMQLLEGLLFEATRQSAHRQRRPRIHGCGSSGDGAYAML